MRVLIVDTVRAECQRLASLVTSGGFEVVGTATQGHEALAAACALQPDIIAMHVDLPGMNGYLTTQQIMQQCPTRVVLMTSAASTEQTQAAQAAGALALVVKPWRAATDCERTLMAFLATLRTMARVPVITRHARRPFPLHDTTPGSRDAGSSNPAGASFPAPQVLAIAASTGGPAAVQAVLQGLGAQFPLPILLVQHITCGFTTVFAEWLNRAIPHTIVIVEGETRLQPGSVYMAADSHHLLVRMRGFVALSDASEADRYCPSADTLFASVASVYGQQALGVILTGMGDDGARGLDALRRARGWIVAQDEASSVVHGMPGAAIAAGAVTHVVPLQAISTRILQHLQQFTSQEGKDSSRDSRA